ncbi:hypothetical protein HC766_05935 [Candidatus Gracilibacteria bacterium]|nr:hypothetical protein [Candidatus Gracilibacteria bacterium]
MQKTYIIGSTEPVAVNSTPVNLANLQSLNDLAQLNSLHPTHINFNLNNNSEQLIRNFLQKLDNLFDKIPNINQKRNYLMNFLQSPLFNSYLNTGITALRHPEIQPSKVVLNTLNHIDTKYLNNKQFVITSKISNHIRSIVAL